VGRFKYTSVDSLPVLKPKAVAMGQRFLNALTGKTEPESLELGPFDVKVLTAP
jgi:hypothetical protein